jgi:hypothetical protein
LSAPCPSSSPFLINTASLLLACNSPKPWPIAFSVPRRHRALLLARALRCRGISLPHDEDAGDHEEEVDEAAANHEEKEVDEAAGDHEEEEVDEAAGNGQEEEVDKVAGDHKEEEVDEAAGDHEEEEGDEAAGDHEEEEVDEAAGDHEERRSTRPDSWPSWLMRPRAGPWEESRTAWPTRT